jgi:hypothetical protein
MVKAYFETNSHCELIAVFNDEETYEACLPALEKLAKKHNFDRVTESVVENFNFKFKNIKLSCNN